MDEADSPVYVWFVCTYLCRILVKQTHALAYAPFMTILVNLLYIMYNPRSEI